MVKKKTSSTNLTQKARKIMKGDIFQSIAVASVLLNILFFVTIFVLTSTNTFDHKLYSTAREHYCTNTTAVKDRAEELGSQKKAEAEWQVECIGKDFKPFYQEALDKFTAQQQAN